MTPAPARDPHRVLGVTAGATPDEIKRAYRRLAKQYHPDHNPGPKGEERFRLIREAYEALCQSPPETAEKASSSENPDAPKSTPRSEAAGGLFGRLKGFADRMNAAGTADAAGPDRAETDLEITLEEAIKGTTRALRLNVRDRDAQGRSKVRTHTVQVKLPPGTRDGRRLRLKIPGAPGHEAVIHVRIAPQGRFTLNGADLQADLHVSPWEAALGERVEAPTPEGPTKLQLPSGVSSGQMLRLRGRGLADESGRTRGDIVYHVLIDVPRTLTPQERALFEKLRDLSRFDARRGR